MKEFGEYLAVNLRDEELGGPQLIARIPTVLTVDQARQLKDDLGQALLHASPSFVKQGMERRDAAKEALRRWGGYGSIFDRVEDNTGSVKPRMDVGRYWVGSSRNVPGHIFGNGNSWEEAFAAADLKEKELTLTD